jgi:hypothetical protein
MKYSILIDPLKSSRIPTLNQILSYTYYVHSLVDKGEFT